MDGPAQAQEAAIAWRQMRQQALGVRGEGKVPVFAHAYENPDGEALRTRIGSMLCTQMMTYVSNSWPIEYAEPGAIQHDGNVPLGGKVVRATSDTPVKPK